MNRREEALIVLVIIGFLAVIAIPRFCWFYAIHTTLSESR